MAKSILQARRECYICRECYCIKTERGLEEHHILGGPLRPFSERYGLKVYLCRTHHNTQRAYSVHFDAQLAAWLKARAQTCFEARYSHAQWMADVGINYTDHNGKEQHA